MTIFDIVLVTFLIISFVGGFIKGLFSEIASLVAVVAGIFCSIHFSYYTEDFLRESILDWNDKTNKIVAYIATFLFIVLVVIFIGKILTKLADITALGLVNKILGGFFSVLKLALIFSVIFFFLDRLKTKIPFLSQVTIEKSVLYEPIKSIVPTLFPSLVYEDEDGNKTFNFPDISL